MTPTVFLLLAIFFIQGMTAPKGPKSKNSLKSLIAYPIINSCTELQSSEYINVITKFVSYVEKLAKDASECKDNRELLELKRTWKDISTFMHKGMPKDVVNSYKKGERKIKRIYADILDLKRKQRKKYKNESKKEMEGILSEFIVQGEIDYYWHPESKQMPFAFIRLLKYLNKTYNVNTASYLFKTFDDSIGNFEEEYQKLCRMLSSIVHFRRLLNDRIRQEGIKWGTEPSEESLSNLSRRLMDDKEDPITINDIYIWCDEKELFRKQLIKLRSSKCNEDPNSRENLEQFAYLKKNFTFTETECRSI